MPRRKQFESFTAGCLAAVCCSYACAVSFHPELPQVSICRCRRISRQRQGAARTQHSLQVSLAMSGYATNPTAFPTFQFASSSWGPLALSLPAPDTPVSAGCSRGCDLRQECLPSHSFFAGCLVTQTCSTSTPPSLGSSGSTLPIPPPAALPQPPYGLSAIFHLLPAAFAG